MNGATSRLMQLHFVRSESTFTYFEATRGYLKQHGKPLAGTGSSIQDTPDNGVTPGVNIPLGMPTMGGPLVTKGGLKFFHGSLDYYVRAFDNSTGRELWRGRLPVDSQGASMTYMGEDGKQYVAVIAGRATRTGTNAKRGNYVIAYALP